MLQPATEADLAEAVKTATGPLRVVGGGTRDIGRPVVGTALSVTGLHGIDLYEPGALTVVVRAGTPLDDLERALAAENQRLPFEPMDHRPLLGTTGTPTIGGVVAANVSGPRRVQGGACRDFLLGVRFVDGTGTVVKNGGRVMKNVTGYDLVKLMAGSWGTLGVLTELSFKVLARPETETTLVAEGLTAEQGVAALSRALGSPFDVSGAAHVGGGQTLVRVEGLEGSVRYRAGRLAELLPGFETVSGDQSAALWRDVRDVNVFAGREGAVWRVSVKPTDGPVLSAALTSAGVPHEALFDWGGGLVWLLMPSVSADTVRHEVAALGGHATLVRATQADRAAVPVFQPEPAPLAAITTGLRQRFDPRGLLNPGLMG